MPRLRRQCVLSSQQAMACVQVRTSLCTSMTSSRSSLLMDCTGSAKDPTSAPTIKSSTPAGTAPPPVISALTTASSRAAKNVAAQAFVNTNGFDSTARIARGALYASTTITNTHVGNVGDRGVAFTIASEASAGSVEGAPSASMVSRGTCAHVPLHKYELCHRVNGCYDANC